MSTSGRIVRHGVNVIKYREGAVPTSSGSHLPPQKRESLVFPHQNGQAGMMEFVILPARIPQGPDDPPPNDAAAA